MDSEDDDVYDAPVLSTVTTSTRRESSAPKKATVKRWDLRGMSVEEMRALSVSTSTEESCDHIEALPEEMLREIVHCYIGLHEEANATYFSLMRARHIANVSKTMWRITHELPPINVEIGSVNSVDICKESNIVDADGDELVVPCGMWRGFLQVRDTKRKSVLKMDNGKFAPLLDVSVQMKIRSFVNYQPEEDRIDEWVHTFSLNPSAFKYSPSQMHDNVCTRANGGQYDKTMMNTFRPCGAIELDIDGVAIIDDEVPRVPVMLREAQCASVKDAAHTKAFRWSLHVSEKVIHIRAHKQLSARLKESDGRTDGAYVPTDEHLEFSFRIRPLLHTMQHAICPYEMHEKIARSERTARKRAMLRMEQVRLAEDESNIAALMRDHDEESYERTDEKRRKLAALKPPQPAAGPSSAALTIDEKLHTLRHYLVARERQLMAEYDASMDAASLPLLDGRLSEVHALMALM